MIISALLYENKGAHMGKLKIILGAAAGLAAAAAGGLTVYLTENIMHGKRQTLAEAWEWQTNHYDTSWFGKPETTDYIVKSYDGYELHATYVPNAEETSRYVILTHGYTDNRLGMMKYMKIYFDAGYNCIIYDIRDHGENARSFCTYSIRESQDLISMINDTYERYGKDIFLGLHGESLGAATTVRAMMYHPDVKFAVADCGFADIENVLEGVMKYSHLPVSALKAASKMAKLKYGYEFSEMRPIDALADNKVPFLFIHGENDTFILPDNSRRMKEATAGYAELHLIPGAKHANSVLTDPEKYAEYVKEFLRRAENGDLS